MKICDPVIQKYHFKDTIILKTYPSIPKTFPNNQTAYLFDKLDGSNIRVEWSKKKGFHKFGTRKRLLGHDEPILGKSYQLIEQFDQLAKIFIDQRWTNVTTYFEFCGPNSFAGYHNPNDNHTLTLIDVNVYKKGFVAPNDFIKIFKTVNTANLVYRGNVNSTIISDIKNGTLPGVTFEGVVGKYIDKKQHKLFKIKSNAWIEKLKLKCGDDQKLFEMLS